VWLIALLPTVAQTQGSVVGWCSLSGDFGYASTGGSAVTSMLGDVAAGSMTTANSLVIAGFLANRLTWGSVTAIHDRPAEIPLASELLQNFPNPFNPSTVIRYGLSQKSNVDLALFNTLGQRVAILAEGEQPAGYHEVRFEGRGLPSGAYFYRIRAGSYVATRKMLLMK
jgi:hypothetical protein